MKRLTLKEQWEFIKPFWRILLATMIIQIIGGIVGIYQNFYGALLINFWFGSVVSTMPGFIVGLIWQYINSPKLIYQNRLIIALFGIISVILTISAFVMPLEQMGSSLKKIEDLLINSH